MAKVAAAQPSTPPGRSCNQCRTRKTRCDRQNPCAQCRMRGWDCRSNLKWKEPQTCSNRPGTLPRQGDTWEKFISNLEQGQGNLYHLIYGTKEHEAESEPAKSTRPWGDHAVETGDKYCSEKFPCVSHEIADPDSTALKEDMVTSDGTRDIKIPFSEDHDNTLCEFSQGSSLYRLAAEMVQTLK